MKDNLLNKVLSTISRFSMLQKGDSVLISVSGGPDSVFLADALNQLKALYGLKLYCFHLDHKTRNGQSSQDAAFVRDFCGSIGLKLFSEEIDVKEWCRQNRLSFQDGARRLRLDLLNETAEKNRIKRISTGHTADDNAETFLMHLLRGSGLRGLSGIRPVNGPFIRPLLEIFHTDILEYLAENKIPYCSDRTNMENIYSRNKIRNVLIPFVNNNFSKNFVKNLSGTIDIIRQEDAFIGDYARECLKKISEMSAETIKIPLIKLRAYPEPVIKRIIISAIELVNGDFTDIRRENLTDITKLCFSGSERKELFLRGGARVIRESENLYFHKTFAEDAQTAVIEEIADFEILNNNIADFKPVIDKKTVVVPKKSVFVPKKTVKAINDKIAEKVDSPGQDIEIEIGSKQELEIAGVKYLIEAFLGGSDFLKDKNIKSSEAYLDFEKIRFPVKVDYWHKTGERFMPLGLKDFKKIQDYFTDMKIQYGKRPQVPLFYDREKIIWVGNYRIDERAKIDGQTKKIFHIKIIDI